MVTRLDGGLVGLVGLWVAPQNGVKPDNVLLALVAPGAAPMLVAEKLASALGMTVLAYQILDAAIAEPLYIAEPASARPLPAAMVDAWARHEDTIAHVTRVLTDPRFGSVNVGKPVRTYQKEVASGQR